MLTAHMQQQQQILVGNVNLHLRLLLPYLPHCCRIQLCLSLLLMLPPPLLLRHSGQPIS